MENSGNMCLDPCRLCLPATYEALMNECTEAYNYHVKMENKRAFKVMFKILLYVCLGFAW